MVMLEIFLFLSNLRYALQARLRTECSAWMLNGRCINISVNLSVGREAVLSFLFMFMYWQARGINLSGVRTCVVVAEERPRVALTHSFSKLFKDIGLSSRAVSTTFGSRVNVAICLQVTAESH